MSTRAGLFSRRVLFWLVTIGVISFLGSIALMVGGGGTDPGARYGGHPNAVSAIGYKAFVRTLERLGAPVVLSGFDSAGKARGGVLIIAEPRLDGWRAQAFPRLLRADRSIVVLPKWRGRPSRGNRRWVGRVGLLPRTNVEQVLNRIDPGARIVRPGRAPAFYPSRFSAAPDLPVPQLIRSRRLQPLVESPNGMLAGVMIVGGRRVLVVADPDVFSNHGLGRGGNAQIAVGLVNSLRPSGGTRGPIVFDTALLGVEKKPSLVRSLFELPFVVGTASGIAALIILLWAGAARFGAPRPVRPAFAPGKVTLIENGTRLLRFGGHQREILDRYRRAVLAVVAARMHAPVGEARAQWLDRVGTARGTAELWSALTAHVDDVVRDKKAPDRRLVEAARRLEKWKREMVDGS
ncbi:MAG TPA: DUF4350 domain-containing protein [Alphaproteobacteria bacterium]|nr:DUF4350 domain-containing protein [Alphaproteobacteria bacterium]